MEQVLVAVTGPDRSGVVYTVAEALHKLKCSFVDMDQTTVRNQFSSIMIVEKQEALSKEEIRSAVNHALEEKQYDMSVLVRECVPGKAVITKGEPFVLTVDGKESKEIILAYTKIFLESKINIDSFRSIENVANEDGEVISRGKDLLVFEVTIPFEVDRKALHRTLYGIAKDHNLSMSMQHRRIFEAVHRVTTA